MAHTWVLWLLLSRACTPHGLSVFPAGKGGMNIQDEIPRRLWKQAPASGTGMPCTRPEGSWLWQQALLPPCGMFLLQGNGDPSQSPRFLSESAALSFPANPVTIQIMTGFLHIGFGIVLTTLTNVYTSVFVIGEIPFLGGVSFIISGCLSIGAEKSPTECAVKGSQTMNVISAIFALLGIVAFIVDLNLNGLYRSSFNYYSYLVLLAGNGISIVLLIFTILEFCIAVATANFWCRATRLSSNEAMLIVPSATRVDLAVPPAELPQPPSYSELAAPEV
uniref:Membrane-spanning 4-domains subfamily A member 12-like n=1 Tax=Serinus canaria TaxID=9135 RepID=A0A8C9N795_SERCA